MAQQTAVEWFFTEVSKLFCELENRKLTAGRQAVKLMDLFEQADKMEKMQLHKCASFWSGKEGEIETPIFNQYYNETFGK